MNPRAGSTLLNDVVLGRGGGQPALVCPEDGLRWSHDQLREQMDELARDLTSLGVRAGDRVAFVLANGPEVIALLLAVTSLGAAAAPLNPAYTESEFSFYLADLRPYLLVLPGDGNAAALAASSSEQRLAALAWDKGQLQLRSEASPPRRGEPPRPPRPEDVALLLHTSGTTSRPKQVPLLHRNLAASTCAIAAHYALTETDVSGCAMPLFHVHGLVGSCLAALAAGGSAFVPRRLSASRFYASVAEEDISWFSASPTIHKMILERAATPRSEPRVERLRFLRSCSAPLPTELAERLEEFYGVPLLNAYGMTEASHQICSNPPPPGRRSYDSVGPPTGVELSITDEAGAHVPVGVSGEVVIRGPNVTQGYLDNPEANEHGFVDGWFRTGDRGAVDEDGYLRLEGRLKEMINRGGENISPYEVEEVLLSHPAVIEAVCYGRPDEKYGEEVAAAVVLASAATTDELARLCRQRLAAFKVPKTFAIVEAIPRTATGKVQRSRLAAMLADEAS